jgi:hypothetical protein
MSVALVLLWPAGEEFLSAEERVRWCGHFLPSDQCRSANFARQAVAVSRHHAQLHAARGRRTGSRHQVQARSFQKQSAGSVRRGARRLANGQRWVTSFTAV